MIRLGLVGCGNMAHWHAQQLLKVPELRVTALCDPFALRTAEFRERFFNQAQEYEHYEKMLESAELDAVLLVTPHALHYPQAMQAMQRGLHVLCEKPMVTNSEQAYELWRTSVKTGMLLGIAFQSPYTAEFGYLADLRDAGKLGSLQNIAGYVSQNWYRSSAGKWRQDPLVSGGGFIYDTGAHMLNAIMWLTNSPVIEVNCYIDKADTAVDIRGSAAFRFQNGAFGSVTMAGNTPMFRSEISIFTERFLIVTDQYGSRLDMFDGNGSRFYPHVPHQAHPAAGSPHLNFANAILGKERLRAPARCGVLLSALMDAMYESANLATPIKVNPVPDQISG